MPTSAAGAAVGWPAISSIFACSEVKFPGARPLYFSLVSFSSASGLWVASSSKRIFRCFAVNHNTVQRKNNWITLNCCSVLENYLKSQLKLLYDQLWAALLIGRNAITWCSSLSNDECVGGQPYRASLQWCMVTWPFIKPRFIIFECRTHYHASFV